VDIPGTRIDAPRAASLRAGAHREAINCRKAEARIDWSRPQAAGDDFLIE